MTQERLNYLMLLSIHNNKIDEFRLIDIIIANQFCQGNRDRKLRLENSQKAISQNYRPFKN